MNDLSSQNMENLVLYFVTGQLIFSSVFASRNDPVHRRRHTSGSLVVARVEGCTGADPSVPTPGSCNAEMIRVQEG